MNLHGLVSQAIATVNPMVQVGVQFSTGSVPATDFTAQPTYATPGAIMASIAGDVLTVTAVSAGKLQPGQVPAGAGVNPTMIAQQTGGTPGGVGTYSLSNAPGDVASEPMTTALTLTAQVQALSGRDLRQIEGLNLQGTLKAIYVNGNLSGAVRVELKGGDLVMLPDGSVWLVTLVLEPWNLTAGWTKCVITLQNGA